jgi:hypothetical protein
MTSVTVGECLPAGAPKVEVREQKTQEGEVVETVKDSVCGMEIDNALCTGFFSQSPGSIAATISKPSGGCGFPGDEFQSMIKTPESVRILRIYKHYFYICASLISLLQLPFFFEDSVCELTRDFGGYPFFPAQAACNQSIPAYSVRFSSSGYAQWSLP